MEIECDDKKNENNYNKEDLKNILSLALFDLFNDYEDDKDLE